MVVVYELSYAQVADALAGYHRVADANRTAFRGRLQHFQRLGFPPGINTGRGRSAKYGFWQVLLLALGLELVQFGLSPEKAVSILRSHELAIQEAVKEAFKEAKGWFDEGDFWLGFSPAEMTAAFEKKSGSLMDVDATFFAGGAAMVINLLNAMQHTGRSRLALIHLSGVLRAVASEILGALDQDPSNLRAVMKGGLDGSDS